MSGQVGAVPTEARGRAGAAPRRQAGERGRLEELDALRGLAALGVVLFHYTTFYQWQHGHLQPLGFGFPAGNYGVHLFFLISGFVIFMTLDRARSAGDFMVSRFSRLFPAYWTALGLTALVVYAIGMPAQRPGLATLAANTTMLQEILGFEDVDGSYWTLQVELFFYAQMLFWFALRQLHRMPWIIAGWLLLTLAYALSLRQGWHFSYTARVLLNLLYIPFFALGILFYRLRTNLRGWRLDASLIGLCLVAIAIAYPPVFTLVAIVCCAIFALFVTDRLTWLRAAPFAFFGAISYSLYLLHQAIGFSLIWHLEHGAGLGAGVAAISAASLVTLLALALTFLVERPAMRGIRDAWKHYSRPAAA